MFGLNYYHQTIRKYVTIFGTLFNDIEIDRTTQTGAFVKKIGVPIVYSPRNKLLVRVGENPKLENAVAMSLPRMGFELTAIEFDTERQLNKHNYLRWAPEGELATHKAVLMVPVPYNFTFQLSIMVKNAEDGTKIIEQILPYFAPDYTVAANLIDGYSTSWDLPIILESVATEDVYDGDFETRRTLIWTLDFSLKGYLFGPQERKGIIREINTSLFDGDTAAADALEDIQIVLGIKGQENVDPNTVLATDDYEGIAKITTNDSNTGQVFVEAFSGEFE